MSNKQKAKNRRKAYTKCKNMIKNNTPHGHMFGQRVSIEGAVKYMDRVERMYARINKK